jgi:5-methylcytosine-specific restriction endonuclease McrA
MKTFSMDHAQPLSRGGGNAQWNFRPCCKECNNVKGAMSEEEFLGLQHLIRDWQDGGKYLRGRLKGAGTLFRR